MPDKTYMPKPLTHAQCARRSAIRADGKPKRADAALLDISLDGVRNPRLTRKDGRLRVVASVDGHGIRPERRYERVPVTRLRAKDLDAQLLSREIHGYRGFAFAGHTARDDNGAGTRTLNRHEDERRAQITMRLGVGVSRVIDG